MRLYLVRHAEAAPGEPDELRPLTEGGRGQARALGKRLVSEDAAPAVILTSPLLRARETGDELARADTGGPLQSAVFPAAGWSNDAYLTSFTTLTRIAKA